MAIAIKAMGNQLNKQTRVQELNPFRHKILLHNGPNPPRRARRHQGFLHRPPEQGQLLQKPEPLMQPQLQGVGDRFVGQVRSRRVCHQGCAIPGGTYLRLQLCYRYLWGVLEGSLSLWNFEL